MRYLARARRQWPCCTPPLSTRAFNKLALEDMLVSFDAIVTHRIHRKMFEQIVPSALKYYDLPDLARSLAPRPVWIIDAVNPVGQALPTAQVLSIYQGQNIHIGHRSDTPDFAFE